MSDLAAESFGPRLRFSAVIPDDVVADGDVGELAAGEIITMGFQALLGQDDEEHLDGVVVAARFDSLNQLDEGIVAIGWPPIGVPFLIQVQVPTSTMAVGQHIPLDPVLACVRSYEYSPFNLPRTIQRGWLVVSVERTPARDWRVEIEPLDRDLRPLRMPEAASSAETPPFNIGQTAAVETAFRLAGFNGPLDVAVAIKGDERLFVLPPGPYRRLRGRRELEQLVAQILGRKVFIASTKVYSGEVEPFQ